MISFELGVDDLADTRFAISPIHETVVSLRILRDPGLNVLHLPWRRRTLDLLADAEQDTGKDTGKDTGPATGLLLSLVGTRLALPDFLTPQPAGFVSTFSEELAVVRQADPRIVLRDFVESLSPLSLPDDDVSIEKLRDAACDQLERFWRLAIEPFWPQMRLVMETDMTYRARQLALGGARLLFADMHPNLRWKNSVLYIDKMVGNHHVVAGRGLHLMPSVFSHKPAPAVSPESPPGFAYPSRGIATLWEPVPPVGQRAVRLAGSTPSQPARHPRGTPLDNRNCPTAPGDTECGQSASAGPACHRPGHSCPRRPSCALPPQRSRRPARHGSTCDLHLKDPGSPLEADGFSPGLNPLPGCPRHCDIALHEHPQPRDPGARRRRQDEPDRAACWEHAGEVRDHMLVG